MTIPVPGPVAPAPPDAAGAWVARPAPRRSVRITGAGLALLGLAAGTAAVAIHTGNNRLFLLLASMVAVALLDGVFGAWNLRNVTTSRRLPYEAHAGRAAAGTFLVENRRRAMPAFAVRAEDAGGCARAAFALVPAEGAMVCPATWSFAERGEVRLAGLRLSSAFPFGLLEHRVDLPRPATFVVFPALGVATPAIAARLPGGVPRPDDRRQGGTDDLVSLRAWEPGDPLSRVHWPTTARVGRPMLAVRGGEADEVVVVEVPDLPDPEAWEEALTDACGQVVHHARLGRSVGLRIGRRGWPAARGDAHRRRLLSVLALQPSRVPVDGRPRGGQATGYPTTPWPVDPVPDGRALADGRRLARISRTAALGAGFAACATLLFVGSAGSTVGSAGLLLLAPAAWAGEVRPGGGRSRFVAAIPLLAVLAACVALVAGVEGRGVAAGAAVTLLLHQAATGRGTTGTRRIVLASVLAGCLGAGSAAEPVVGVCLGLLVACASVGLVTATLSGTGVRPSPLGRPRTLAFPLVLALTVPCLAIVLFPVLPRQPGQAADVPVHLVRLSGFDDVVILGALGDTLTDPSPVLRIRAEDASGHALQGPFLLRALALDAFDGRVWRRVGQGSAPAPGVPNPGPVVQHVLLEPMVPTVLPVICQALGISADAGPILRDAAGGWTWAAAPRRLTYTAWSAPPEDAPALDPATAIHLALPPGLDPAVLDLARNAVAPEGDRRSRAESAATWLKTSCTWTPVPEGPLPERAVEDFLLRSRRGHCELFASGLALLVRAEGIPARLVLGFRGGRWNPLAGWWEIRHADAHAWVEVDLGGGRWFPVDGTPGADTPDRAGTAAAAVDWARAGWTSGVLDFTADDQHRALMRAGSALSARATPLGGALPSGLVGLAALLPLVAALLLVLRRAVRFVAGEGVRPSLAQGEVDRAWRRARRLVLQRGWPLPDWLPPLAAADWLLARAGPVAAPLATLARARCAVRYGGTPDAVLASGATRALGALGALPRAPRRPA